MPLQTYVPLDRMRSQLHGIDDLRERLAKTEPLTPAMFSTRAAPTIRYGEDWAKREPTDPAPIHLEVPGGETYQLTKQAAMELASLCRINQGYQTAIDPALLEVNVNWWLHTGLGDKELKLLCAGLGRDAEDEHDIPLAVALCRATVTPFSNLRLLDSVLAGITKKYGTAEGDVLCDYKLQHDLEATAFRLVVPGASRLMTGTGTELDDSWSTGIQVKNSPIGLKQTFVDGYLFRWICTNGQIDVANGSGGFERRGSEEEEVYAWAREAVDEILEGIEDHTMDAVQSLTDQPVERQVVTVLRDLFEQAHLPRREQTRVLEAMAETGGELTMYDMVNAITQVANSDDLPWRSREHLMTMGGWVIHTAGSRCGNCHRLLPPNWAAPDDDPAASPPAGSHDHAHGHGQDVSTAELN
jgi:hypothetical protein